MICTQDPRPALVRAWDRAFEVEPIEHIPAEKKPFLCPKCGGRLVAECIVSATGRIITTFDQTRSERE